MTAEEQKKLEEKISDWHKVTKVTQDVHRAMQTGQHLSLELFEQYLNARRAYETKWTERYHPFIRPIYAELNKNPKNDDWKPQV